jgi:N-methylhydantoinase A
MKLLGIDTGGTFTDFVFYDGISLQINKVLSTPEAPEKAILQGIREMGISMHDLRIIHGSTVATNAVLEGKGARTVYIANRGLQDVLTIGRQARRELYNLQPKAIAPPVEEKYCLQTGGRIGANGEIIEPLTKLDIDTLLTEIEQLMPESVAVNLLFSFIDDQFERKIANALPKELFVSISSEILPEYREYERGITTWLNAYVGPLVHGYLLNLGEQVKPATVSVMRSSGQTCDAEQAGKEAVHLLLSGPAGGLSGARFLGSISHYQNLLTLDMGGTSTDVALIDGDISLTNAGHIAQYPVGVPMVDMHTIGAGGGSIASVDAGGLLLVGPESAGASPGPACYGLGGINPTVTDANLSLGHLPKSALLGGNLRLDYEAARNSIERLVKPLGLDSVEQAAQGIVRVANEHMAQALRLISVQRGIDPREFVLVAFGGAGGLHICALADALGLKKAMAPVQAGVLSALGMLTAPAGRQLSRTIGNLLHDNTVVAVERAIAELADRGKQALAKEGIHSEDLAFVPSLDLCYRGQSSTLNIPWIDIAAAEAEFHERHESQFGHRLDTPIELVNVRMGINAQTLELALPECKGEENPQCIYGEIFSERQLVEIWQRNSLSAAQIIQGPAIILDDVSTILIESGWRGQVDVYGSILLDKRGDI